MRAQHSGRPRQRFGFAGRASATAQAHLRPHGAEGSTAYRASLQDVTASSYTSFQIQGISQLRRLRQLRQLEDENRRLKQIVADLTLDNTALKEIATTNW